MLNSPSLKPLTRLARYSDMALAGLLLLIIGMLIIPLPSWVLDFFLVVNIAVGTMILLTALSTVETLEFSIFPSLLLVMTLFRLSLNVAGTKLILANGEAGAVIAAFGSFVLSGSYIVGIIAFLILVVVQFIVITKGAERVAEVAARFTLDAMPGKQMAIDADLNAGNITEEVAKHRRQTIQREADFYGSMDGASKFVRGDAVASVLIIIINIIGGFAIGLSKGGDVMSVLQQYTLLTVGEGLVSQIPALLISVATGIIVTRAASDNTLGKDFAKQLFTRARPMAIVSGLLLMLALIPGFPKLQLIALSIAVGMAAMAITKNDKKEVKEQRTADSDAAAKAALPASGSENVMSLLEVSRIEIELGSNLVALAMPEEGGDLMDRVRLVRNQIASELGIILPTVRIRDNLTLKSNTYAIKLKGSTIATHELLINCVMALDSGLAMQRFEGIETVEPALGTPAIWIAKTLRERAEMAGYIVVDPSTVLVTHLTEMIRTYAHELITRQETSRLVDNVKQEDEAAVAELIPAMLTLGDVQKVLQALLKERVSVRDLTTILETLADYAPRTKDFDALVEYVRGALSRQICKQHQDEDGTLRVVTIAPSLEQLLRDAVQPTPNGNMLAIEPNLAQNMIAHIRENVEHAADAGYTPVLLVSGMVRIALRRLLERSLPSLTVMSYSEIAPGYEVETMGVVEAELALA